MLGDIFPCQKHLWKTGDKVAKLEFSYLCSIDRVFKMVAMTAVLASVFKWTIAVFELISFAVDAIVCANLHVCLIFL